MSDTSDMTVTSHIWLSTVNLSLGFYCECNKESTTSQTTFMAILLYPEECNENTNLYYVIYSLKCTFTIKVYLSIMYSLVTKATI